MWFPPWLCDWVTWHDANTTYFLCLEFICIVFLFYFIFTVQNSGWEIFNFSPFLHPQLYLDINISPWWWDHAEVFSMQSSLLTSSNVSCFQLLACKTCCALGGVLVGGLSHRYVWENKDLQRRERVKNQKCQKREKV